MERAHLASELIETGTVVVNTPLVAIPEAPFGGIKQSGYGRELSIYGMMEFVNIKTVVFQ